MGITTELPPYLAGDWFAELYRSSWLAMVRLAYALVGSQAVAEDLVQDAFVRVDKRSLSVSVHEPLPER